MKEKDFAIMRKKPLENGKQDTRVEILGINVEGEGEIEVPLHLAKTFWKDHGFEYLYNKSEAETMQKAENVYKCKKCGKHFTASGHVNAHNKHFHGDD